MPRKRKAEAGDGHESVPRKREFKSYTKRHQRRLCSQSFSWSSDEQEEAQPLIFNPPKSSSPLPEHDITHMSANSSCSVDIGDYVRTNVSRESGVSDLRDSRIEEGNPSNNTPLLVDVTANNPDSDTCAIADSSNNESLPDVSANSFMSVLSGCFSNVSSIPSMLHQNVLSPHGELTKDEQIDFRNRLQILCVDRNVPHLTIDGFLDLLRSIPCLKFLRKTAKWLLKTPRKVHTVPVAQGQYYHFKFESVLRDYYMSVEPVDKFNVLIGIDGLPISGSSQSEVWPIMCAIISPNPKKKPYVTCIAIWHGHQKPDDPNAFLAEFVAEADKLLKNGLAIDGKVLQVKITAWTMDGVAKAHLLLIMSHSGYCACPRCKVRGVSDCGRHFPGVDYAARTHTEFSTFENDFSDDTHHHGKCVLADLPGVDLVKDVVCDVMHLLVNVMKHLNNIFLNGKQPRKLNKHKIDMLCWHIQQIRLIFPDEFVRSRPRSIRLCCFWKATEYRQFVLYIGVVIFRNILPEDQYKNFVSLHIAFYILLHPTFGTKYNVKVREIINDFLREYETLYGQKAVTLNVHMLQHLPDDVLRFGDINKIAAWIFENFLGPLKQLVRNGNRPLAQIVCRLVEKEHVSHLKLAREEANRSDDLQPKYERPSEFLLPGFGYPEYQRVEYPSLFTIHASEGIKDSCCLTKENDIVLVRNFATCQMSGEIYAICNKFLVRQDFYEEPMRSSELGIFLVKELDQNLIAVPAKEIMHKFVCLPTKHEEEPRLMDEYVVLPLLHCSTV